jgi:preprotein translocase subunit SecG
MFIFLIVLQAIVAAMLVVVILIQKSEGGGLGVGGSPSGFMSARGAADFMTRATGVLAAIFVGLSIVLAAMAVASASNQKVDTSLDRTVSAPVAAPAVPAGRSAGRRGQEVILWYCVSHPAAFAVGWLAFGYDRLLPF